MELDLDALELRALRFHKLNPLHECFDSTTVLALIAQRRDAWRKADRYRAAIEQALAFESVLPAIATEPRRILADALNDKEAEK